MFNKILSNIAINPSNVNQLVFYANRLRKEQSIRRLGLVFIVAAFFLQIVASAFPAEKSLAASVSNDIIAGGVSSKSDLVNKCNSNFNGVRDIYARFGVSCSEISAATLTTINSSDNYWSMGRNPLSQYGKSSEDWGERIVHVNGKPIYHRPLKSWGSGLNYTVFKVKSGNKYYWIIKDCGNLVTLGPEGPTPNLVVQKKLLTPKTAKPGDTVKFQLLYRNTVPESVAVDFRLRDMFSQNNLSNLVDFVSMTGRTGMQGSDPKIERKGLGFSSSYKESIVAVKIKQNVANGTKICNTANISADVIGVKTSNKVCLEVVVNTPPPPQKVCPYTPTLKESDSDCKPCEGNKNIWYKDPNCKGDGVCVASTSYLDSSSRDIKVTTEATATGTYKVSEYSYDLDVDNKIDANTKTSALSDTKEFKNLSIGTHKIQVAVSFKNGTQTVTKTCLTEVDIDEAKIVQTKTVTDSQGKDMNGKKVSSGDILRFNLSTKNVEKVDSAAYSAEDYFGDVLEYADIVDMNQLKEQGITLDANKYLKWNYATIKAETDEIKTITVKIKQIIPKTNTPKSVGTEADCVISNKYGNQVSVGINCPLVKNIETATTQLPNTGPGTTVTIAFLVTVLASYFFARSRLISKETSIAKSIYQQAI